MKAKEFIIERNYGGPLYHLTEYHFLNTMFQHGIGFRYVNPNDESSYESRFIIDDKYPYFLSASRNLTNSFRNKIGGPRTPYNMSLVLNTQYFNNKDFLIKPIDYWNSWDKVDFNVSLKEGEERIWSKKEYHPFVNCVTEVHIYDNIGLTNGLGEVDNLTKLDNFEIPYFIYGHPHHYRLHRKDKIIQDVL